MYLLSFAVHVSLAALVGAVATVVAGAPTASSSWLGGVLVAIASGHLLLALVVAERAGRGVRRASAGAHGAGSSAGCEDEAAAAARRAGRRAAIGAALAVAVLFSSPAWFAALAWAAGQRGLAFGGLLGVLALGFAGGAGYVGRLARSVAGPGR